MKYIITDKGEVRTGDEFHQTLARGTIGRVVSAGKFNVEDGRVSVYGRSYGFDIESKPEDAELIERALNAPKETLDV